MIWCCLISFYFSFITPPSNSYTCLLVIFFIRDGVSLYHYLCISFYLIISLSLSPSFCPSCLGAIEGESGAFVLIDFVTSLLSREISVLYDCRRRNRDIAFYKAKVSTITQSDNVVKHTRAHTHTCTHTRAHTYLHTYTQEFKTHIIPLHPLRVRF